MTLLDKKERFIVGKDAKNEIEKVDHIKNFEEVVNKLKNIINIASKNDIFLAADCLFFILDKEDNLDVIVGDFDFVTLDGANHSFQNIFNFNKQVVLAGFMSFLELYYLKEDAIPSLKLLIYYKFKDFTAGSV